MKFQTYIPTRIFDLILLSFAFVFILNNKVCSQETRFYLPGEIKQAYEKGTRSIDGRPGKNYWQNTVDYKIDVKIEPKEKLITGSEEVIYHNSGPDELNTLVVRLYADVFKKGNTRMNAIEDEDLTEGVILEEITIDGEAYNPDDQSSMNRNGTNLLISLKKPLLSGNELSLKFSWEQKVPSKTLIRMGAYDSTTFFIAYWYPQIAVYDDIFGWDRLSYTFQNEFYNNLSNYDVTITAPPEYIVWATGTLMNTKEVLPQKYYERWLQAKSSDQTINIITDEDVMEKSNLTSGEWHYVAHEVSDFAFALSDHNNWDAAILNIGDKPVLISSVYPKDTTTDYSNLVALQQKSMKHMSEDFPGIPFPYEAYTSFITNNPRSQEGGMEFPMMANNSMSNRNVIIHEMAHNYFPMYVRTNEERWAWMDEGNATYITAIVEEEYFDEKSGLSNFYSKINPSKYSVMGKLADLPLMTSSQYLTSSNWGYENYDLPAFILQMLNVELGEELFLKCYREYINRWAKKSPTPYDFFYTFEDVSGMDLDWIWKPWFFEFGYADVSIKSFENGELTIINNGNKPVPLLVQLNYKHSEPKTIHLGASIWKNGQNEYQMIIPDFEKIRTVFVNTTIADLNLAENIYPSIQSMYEGMELNPEICGEYKSIKYGFHFNIVKEDGVLFLTTPWGWHKSILPEDNLNFSTLDESIKFNFGINEEGLSTLLLDWFGTSLATEKLE